MPRTDAEKLLGEIGGWELSDDAKHLSREFASRCFVPRKPGGKGATIVFI